MFTRPLCKLSVELNPALNFNDVLHYFHTNHINNGNIKQSNNEISFMTFGYKNSHIYSYLIKKIKAGGLNNFSNFYFIHFVFWKCYIPFQTLDFERNFQIGAKNSVGQGTDLMDKNLQDHVLAEKMKNTTNAPFNGFTQLSTTQRDISHKK